MSCGTGAGERYAADQSRRLPEGGRDLPFRERSNSVSDDDGGSAVEPIDSRFIRPPTTQNINGHSKRQEKTA